MLDKGKSMNASEHSAAQTLSPPSFFPSLLPTLPVHAPTLPHPST